MVRWHNGSDRQGTIYLSQITGKTLGFSFAPPRLGSVGLVCNDGCHWFLGGLDQPQEVIKLV